MSVLIVGAGPVGLSMALLLRRFGVPCVVVERETSRSRHPRARGVRTRTMELFRQWGIAEDLRPAAQTAESLRFIYCDSLAGDEIGRSPELSPTPDDVTPAAVFRIAQELVEDALLERVLGSGADVRRGTELVDFEQDDEGVAARVRSAEGDAAEILRSEYLIGCDGVGSTVRGALGIPLVGNPLLAYWQSVYWRGDIDHLTRDRPCIQFLTGARSGSFVGIAWNRGDRWVTIVQRPAADDRPPDLTAGEARNLVRGAVGADVPVEILDTKTFRVGAEVAERYRDGRVFLVGDAAHSMPPTGGFGMNTGIQDAHNLAWKLTYVMQGVAGAALLDSYDEERRPVATANNEWSVSNAKRMAELRAAIAAEDRHRLEAALADQIRHVGALGQDLGFAYASGAVVNDGSEPPPADPVTYVPTARPGHRAPHLWVERGGRTTSLLDLFDRSYVLLTAPAGGDWTTAARRMDIPLEAYVVGPAGDLRGDAAGFARLYGIDETGAVLVRPDGHVAWRCRSVVADPIRELGEALAPLRLPSAAKR